MILIATFQNQSVSYILSQEHLSDEITPPTFPLSNIIFYFCLVEWRLHFSVSYL